MARIGTDKKRTRATRISRQKKFTGCQTNRSKLRKQRIESGPVPSVLSVASCSNLPRCARLRTKKVNDGDEPPLVAIASELNSSSPFAPPTGWANDSSFLIQDWLWRARIQAQQFFSISATQMSQRCSRKGVLLVSGRAHEQESERFLLGVDAKGPLLCETLVSGSHSLPDGNLWLWVKVALETVKLPLVCARIHLCEYRLELPDTCLQCIRQSLMANRA